jgi:hypothetical protein
MKTLLAALAIVVCSSFAFADTIGPSTGCADSTCLGTSYTLNVINYTGNQLTVDYIIDGTKFTNGTGTIVSGHTDGIFSLALNFSIPVSAVSLLSAPGGTSDWKAQTGGEDSSGCNGKGTPFGCAQVTSLGDMPVVGSMETMPYTWRFLLTTDGSALSDEHVKADFYSYAGSFVNQISLDVPSGGGGGGSVPEPSTLMMFGAGLLIGGGLLRRKFAL